MNVIIVCIGTIKVIIIKSRKRQYYNVQIFGRIYFIGLPIFIVAL